MVKRKYWALGVLVGMGAILLLSRDYKIERVAPPAAGQERLETETARQVRNLSAEETESSNVPESPRHAASEIEKHRVERLAALDKAVRDQQEKVEERRKILSTVVRTKGIIYKGRDAKYSDEAGTAEPVEKKEGTISPDQAEEAARRAQDAMAYIDAKRNFETDEKLLHEMKLRLLSEKAVNKPSGR